MRERTKDEMCQIEILYCSHVAKRQYVQLDVATCTVSQELAASTVSVEALQMLTRFIYI